MKDSDFEQRLGNTQPKFRLNAQVFQILGLLAIALALPITILVLGLNGIWKRQKVEAPMNSQIWNDTTEVPGLRQSLESIAQDTLPVVPLESSMRIFRLQLAEPERNKLNPDAFLNLFRRSQASFAETGNAADASWIVTVKANQSFAFEEELVKMGFFADQNSDPSKAPNSDLDENKNHLYKILIEHTQ